MSEIRQAVAVHTSPVIATRQGSSYDSGRTRSLSAEGTCEAIPHVLGGLA